MPRVQGAQIGPRFLIIDCLGPLDTRRPCHGRADLPQGGVRRVDRSRLIASLRASFMPPISELARVEREEEPAVQRELLHRSAMIWHER